MWWCSLKWTETKKAVPTRLARRPSSRMQTLLHSLKSHVSRKPPKRLLIPQLFHDEDPSSCMTLVRAALHRRRTAQKKPRTFSPSRSHVYLLS